MNILKYRLNRATKRSEIFQLFFLSNLVCHLCIAALPLWDYSFSIDVQLVKPVIKCMRPSLFVGWNEMRREACAEASAFQDLPARITRETNRLRALPRACVVDARWRTVCHYYYYDNRHDLAANVEASKPYWMEGAGGRDETERRAAPCTHPVPPLTCPRTHPAVTCPYPVYRCYQIRREYKEKSL